MGGQAEFNSDEQRLIGEGDDEGCRGELAARRVRGDNCSDEALPQMSNISIMQQSTC
jgi:hypothetical protein